MLSLQNFALQNSESDLLQLPARQELLLVSVSMNECRISYMLLLSGTMFR